MYNLEFAGYINISILKKFTQLIFQSYQLDY